MLKKVPEPLQKKEIPIGKVNKKDKIMKSNGIEKIIVEKAKELGASLAGIARIEDLKNQLSLISALKGAGIPLVLVGGLNPAHRSYCRRVLSEVEKEKHFFYIEPLAGEMLKSAYAAAKVHVLPSWFETVGLTSLEAGLAGCNIVSTDRGYAHDYLDEYAWYCDPSKGASIRNAVMAAYAAPKCEKLKDHIKRTLNMEKICEDLIDVYQKTLTGYDRI